MFFLYLILINNQKKNFTSIFTFDVLVKISYDVAKNNRRLRNWSDKDLLPIPWYKNTKYLISILSPLFDELKYHGVVISILAGVGWAIFQWKENPYSPTVEPWQKGVFITICIFWFVFLHSQHNTTQHNTTNTTQHHTTAPHHTTPHHTTPHHTTPHHTTPHHTTPHNTTQHNTTTRQPHNTTTLHDHKIYSFIST
jgi:hypothetical protein